MNLLWPRLTLACQNAARKIFAIFEMTEGRHFGKPGTLTATFMKTSTLLLVGIICLTSCNSKPKVSLDIDSVTIAAQNYMGGGPFLAVKIEKSLNLEYYGGHNSDPIGFYTGKITPSKWNTIKQLLAGINYQSLDTAYPLLVDAAEIEIVIRSDQNITHILLPQSRLPSSAKDAFDEILSTYKSISLFSTSDSLRFETSIQEFQQPIEGQNIEFIPPRK